MLGFEKDMIEANAKANIFLLRHLINTLPDSDLKNEAKAYKDTVQEAFYRLENFEFARKQAEKGSGKSHGVVTKNTM